MHALYLWRGCSSSRKDAYLFFFRVKKRKATPTDKLNPCVRRVPCATAEPLYHRQVKVSQGMILTLCLTHRVLDKSPIPGVHSVSSTHLVHSRLPVPFLFREQGDGPIFRTRTVSRQAQNVLRLLRVNLSHTVPRDSIATTTGSLWHYSPDWNRTLHDGTNVFRDAMWAKSLPQNEKPKNKQIYIIFRDVLVC